MNPSSEHTYCVPVYKQNIPITVPFTHVQYTSTLGTQLRFIHTEVYHICIYTINTQRQTDRLVATDRQTDPCFWRLQDWRSPRAPPPAHRPVSARQESLRREITWVYPPHRTRGSATNSSPWERHCNSDNKIYSVIDHLQWKWTNIAPAEKGGIFSSHGRVHAQRIWHQFQRLNNYIVISCADQADANFVWTWVWIKPNEIAFEFLFAWCEHCLTHKTLTVDIFIAAKKNLCHIKRVHLPGCSFCTFSHFWFSRFHHYNSVTQKRSQDVKVYLCQQTVQQRNWTGHYYIYIFTLCLPVFRLGLMFIIHIHLNVTSYWRGYPHKREFLLPDNWSFID